MGWLVCSHTFYIQSLSLLLAHDRAHMSMKGILKKRYIYFIDYSLVCHTRMSAIVDASKRHGGDLTAYCTCMTCEEFLSKAAEDTSTTTSQAV